MVVTLQCIHWLTGRDWAESDFIKIFVWLSHIYNGIKISQRPKNDFRHFGCLPQKCSRIAQAL